MAVIAAKCSCARRPLHATRVVLLGGFELCNRGIPVHIGNQTQRIIALVALRKVSRVQAAGLLWPDVGESRAQASLRTALWRAGRACPGILRRGGPRLSLKEDICVDVRELEAWAVASYEAHTAERGKNIVLPPVTGDLLPGWYDDWVLVERERVRQLRLHALEAVARALLSMRHYGLAVQAALAAIADDPLRESPHRVLVEIYLHEGNRSEAIRHYAICRDLLRRELGVEPTPELQRLVMQADATRLPGRG